MMAHKIPIKKTEKVEEIKNLMHKHKIIGVASLQKVRAAQLQELRKKLETSAYLHVTKNTIMKRWLKISF